MNEKLDHIDSLRGVAILMVILTHTSQSLPKLSPGVKEVATGFTQFGVQLFFIVSAFTLCRSADRRKEESQGIRKFFIRRFFRIAPLYYVGILWYLFYYSLQKSLKKGAFRIASGYTVPNVLANFLLVHGFYPPANNNIVPGGWTIGTEVAFYLCFPILFLLLEWMNKKGTARFLTLFFGMIGIYYLLESLYVMWAGIPVVLNSFIYCNLLNQLPVFMLGILAYFLARDHGLAKIPMMINLFFLCLFTALTVFLWNTSSANLQPFMFIPFTAGLAFVFLYNLFAQLKILNPWILRKIGQVSFSMYIWHFMFAWDGMQLINKWLGYSGNLILRLGVYYLLTISLTFILALISEKFIEKPGIYAGRWLIQKIGNA